MRGTRSEYPGGFVGIHTLPAQTRDQALVFARIGDPQFRSSFLLIARLAEKHSKDPWWDGEEVFPGCLTNGPALGVKGGGKIPTCLVQLPDGWLSTSDTYLRTRHYRLYDR